jgi:hypothetical protein
LRSTLVDLRHEFGGVGARAADGPVLGDRGVAQELDERPGDDRVVALLEREPAVVHGPPEFGDGRRVDRGGFEEAAEALVAFERLADGLDLHLVEAAAEARAAPRFAAEELSGVDAQRFGEFGDDRVLVEAADAALDLVDPALGLADPVGEDLLGHAAALSPIGDAPSHRLRFGLHVRPHRLYRSYTFRDLRVSWLRAVFSCGFRSAAAPTTGPRPCRGAVRLSIVHGCLDPHEVRSDRRRTCRTGRPDTMCLPSFRPGHNGRQLPM